MLFNNSQEKETIIKESTSKKFNSEEAKDLLKRINKMNITPNKKYSSRKKRGKSTPQKQHDIKHKFKTEETKKIPKTNV